MRNSRRLMRLMFGLALIPGLAGLSPGVPATPRATATLAAAGAATSVQPTDLAWVAEVSHTGRWVMGDGGILDRQTGSMTPASGTGGFVRDNPSLFVQNESSMEDVENGYRVRREPIWLLNAATGARTRVDTDSAGNPLVPAWTGRGVSEDPSSKDSPQVFVSYDSVTRDGSTVAFCANYEVPNQFTLYVKNTITGALTKRTEGCGVGGPDPGGEYVRVGVPEISYNGRVIHLRGAVYADGQDDLAFFYPDTLVFPTGSKPSRTVNGNGLMTRDGKLIFLRVGTRTHGTVDRTRGRVGVYSVATNRTKVQRTQNAIYGNDPLWFGSDKTTWRGRYVLDGNKASVIDRRTGRTYNYGKVMRRHGYPPNRVNSGQGGPIISGDGKVILARSGGKYVAVDWR